MHTHAVHDSAEASELRKGFWLFGYGSLVWKTGPLRVRTPTWGCLHVRTRPCVIVAACTCVVALVDTPPYWIQGWVRRFWQGSPDHRGADAVSALHAMLLHHAHVLLSCTGTSERPGRVVTLVKCPCEGGSRAGTCVGDGRAEQKSGQESGEGRKEEEHVPCSARVDGMLYFIGPEDASDALDLLDHREKVRLETWLPACLSVAHRCCPSLLALLALPSPCIMPCESVSAHIAGVCLAGLCSLLACCGVCSDG